MKKIKFPKKAKLISNSGFYKIIDIDSKFRPPAEIRLPIMRKFEINDPVINYMVPITVHLDFCLVAIKKGYAEYKQVDG